MKDYVLETNKKFTLRVYNTQDFVIYYIVEPGKKLYYVQHDGDIIHCVSGKNYAHLFTNISFAYDVVNILKHTFGIEFTVESYM